MTSPQRSDRSRVVVVGSCNLDQVLTVPVAPGPGVTVSARAYVEEPGGKGLNQALAAARAGARVAFVGAVGDDDPGRLVREVLHAATVDVDLLRVVDTGTGRAVIVVDDDRENRIILLPGANGTVTSLGAPDRVAVAAADAVLLQLELPMSVVLEAARTAAEAGALVGLTPAPVQPLPDGLLADVSVLFANEHELAAITDESDLDRGLAALLDRVPAAVVTLGARGSVYADRAGARHRVDAIAVEPVDTTAAGDVYAGVFVATHTAGAGVREAMARASVAAALAVTRRGTSGSIPTAQEVDDPANAWPVAPSQG